MTPAILVRLDLLQGDDDQETRAVTMKDQDTVLVQRSSDDHSKNLPSTDSNLNISNGAVSRSHATILAKSRDYSMSKSTKVAETYGVYIVDSGSRHGTYVNDERVSNGQERELRDGDIVKFGIDIERPNESSFHAPAYLVTFDTPEEKAAGQRGASYSVPDDVESIYEPDSQGSYSDNDSSLDVAETILEEQSAVIDLTQNEDAQQQILENRHTETNYNVFDVDEEEILEHIGIKQAAPSTPLSTDYTRVYDSSSEDVLHSTTKAIVTIFDDSCAVTPPSETSEIDEKVGYPEVDRSDDQSGSELAANRPNRKRSYEEAMSQDDEATEFPALKAIVENSVIVDTHTTIQRGPQEPYETITSVISSEQPRPAKRSRLSTAALSVGMFLAGSTTTFAALAYLPDIA